MVVAAAAITETIRDKENTHLRVLVVEDHADTAASMAMVLRLYGYEVQVAGDGPTALRAAQDDPPDVALLDIQLPGMDGYEVARQLQQRESQKKPFLIAITGCGWELDRLRSAEVGIDLHLLKPVNPDDLQRILTRFQRIIAN